MSDYWVAVLLGFSFGNLWVCALLVFSLQTTNRSTCAGYLVGRVLAIIALSVVIAAVGKMIFVPQGVLNIISGLLLIGFSAYLAFTRLFTWVPPWKKARPAHQEGEENCDHDCKTCPAHGHVEYMKACASCDSSKICEAEEPEVEQLTRQARVKWNREVQEDKLSGFSVGAAIGALRGATMCHKLVVLVPILLSASMFKAFGLGLSFSLSSTIYPLLGFAFGAFALKLLKYKKWLFAVSCILLVLAGARYLIKGIMV
ncbi:MAG: hypothetical protein JXQ83_00040 [Candidatus Glassbacteria bacterium]|nr:hypothetical protein [Candidatus Glassbacteria bacterium]